MNGQQWDGYPVSGSALPGSGSGRIPSGESGGHRPSTPLCKRLKHPTAEQPGIGPPIVLGIPIEPPHVPPAPNPNRAFPYRLRPTPALIEIKVAIVGAHGAERALTDNAAIALLNPARGGTI